MIGVKCYFMNNGIIIVIVLNVMSRKMRVLSADCKTETNASMTSSKTTKESESDCVGDFIFHRPVGNIHDHISLAKSF